MMLNLKLWRNLLVAWGWAVLLSCLVACGTASSSDSFEEPRQVISPQLRFAEVSEAAGVVAKHESGAYGEFFMPEIMGGGAAFFDYNQDHWPDILMVGGGAWEKSQNQSVPTLRLWENQKDGTFREVSQELGLDQIDAYGFGVSIGDVDNDGDQDIYLTALGENLLLIFDGEKFQEQGKARGVAGKKAWSTASIFFDADQDGFLDLFVGNYLIWNQEMDRNIWCSIDGVSDNYCHPDLYEGEQGVFYHNNGDGSFSDWTEQAGFIGPNGIAPIKTLGLAAMDVDQDGWMDLVLANDMQPDLLFHNRGDGTFEEIGIASGIAYNRQGKPRAGMGIVTGDLDQSGRESIVVGNFSRQPISVFKSMPGGMFIDQTYPSQIGKPSFLTLTFGLSLFDADLDGDQDLFAANGHVFTDIDKKAANITFRQTPHFFLNQGNGVFSDQAEQIGAALRDSLVARASAYADYDQDGDLDLLISENNGSLHLLRNEGQNLGNYFRCLLRSDSGNLDAIGARVELFYGQQQRQIKWVKSSEGYLSQSELPLTFGLGAAGGVDSLRIRWPEGDLSVYRDLEPNQYYLFEQKKQRPTRISWEGGGA
ncbi:MAG: CRTAC1 family protein [Bacteroidota bacterium]